MASGQDPLADMQNLIGFQGLVGPNKYTNPAWNDIPYPFGQGAAYSPQGQAMPGFAQYNTGVFGNRPPTDAMGVPIKGFVDYSNDQNAQYAKALAAYNANQQAAPAPTPGTTLNSMPGGYPAGSAGATPAIQELLGNFAATQAGKSPQQLAIDAQNNAFRQQQLQKQDYLTSAANAGGGFGQSPGGAFNPGTGYSPSLGSFGAGAPAAAGSSGPPPPTPTNLHDAYMDALSNPGPIQPVGAYPPQPGQTPTGSAASTPSVMNAFLAANAGKSTPFLSTLRGLNGG
jgi:hypothetical protein